MNYGNQSACFSHNQSKTAFKKAGFDCDWNNELSQWNQQIKTISAVIQKNKTFIKKFSFEYYNSMLIVISIRLKSIKMNYFT